MKIVLDTSFDEELGQKMANLRDPYNELRGLLLEISEQYDLDPEYTHENESGRETPEGFNYFGHSFSIRDTKLFHIISMGSQSEIHKAISELRKILNDPQLITESELVVEIFGSPKQQEIELENRLEKQKRLEEQMRIETERIREYKEEWRKELKEAAE